MITIKFTKDITILTLVKDVAPSYKVPHRASSLMIFQMILEILNALLAIFLTTTFMYRGRRGTRPFEHFFVVITGCDSGFGRLAAERFDSLGMHVFAGCLQEKRFLEIKERCTDNMVPIVLDVTKQDNIENLLTQVQEKLPFGTGIVSYTFILSLL